MHFDIYKILSIIFYAFLIEIVIIYIDYYYCRYLNVKTIWGKFEDKDFKTVRIGFSSSVSIEYFIVYLLTYLSLQFFSNLCNNLSINMVFSFAIIAVITIFLIFLLIIGKLIEKGKDEEIILKTSILILGILALFISIAIALKNMIYTYSLLTIPGVLFSYSIFRWIQKMRDQENDVALGCLSIFTGIIILMTLIGLYFYLTW